MEFQSSTSLQRKLQREGTEDTFSHYESLKCQVFFTERSKKSVYVTAVMDNMIYNSVKIPT